jgi:hypothetical protein
VSGSSGRDPLLAPGPRAAVLERLSRLTIDDLQRLDAAVRALGAEKPYRGRVDKGFWLAWYEGPRLTTAERGDVGELFPAVVVAIASGLTGLDIKRFGAGIAAGERAGVFGDLVRLVRPVSADRTLQHAAIALIEDAVAPWDPRLAIMACWNVACAATLRAHLTAPVVDVLERAWRQALGDPPA